MNNNNNKKSVLPTNPPIPLLENIKINSTDPAILLRRRKREVKEIKNNNMKKRGMKNDFVKY